jgi:hypothetical protein
MSSGHLDYALIAHMEREIYGQTFGHEKAPGPCDKGDACWYCGQHTTRKYRLCSPCHERFSRVSDHALPGQLTTEGPNHD